MSWSVLTCLVGAAGVLVAWVTAPCVDRGGVPGR
jgi:hypothetical protein